MQEEDQAREELKRKIEENIRDKEREIVEVKKNIEIFEKSRQLMLSKQQFLESNMKVKHSKSGSTGEPAPVLTTAHIDAKSSLILLQQQTGCTFDQIQ